MWDWGWNDVSDSGTGQLPGLSSNGTKKRPERLLLAVFYFIYCRDPPATLVTIFYRSSATGRVDISGIQVYSTTTSTGTNTFIIVLPGNSTQIAMVRLPPDTRIIITILQNL